MSCSISIAYKWVNLDRTIFDSTIASHRRGSARDGPACPSPKAYKVDPCQIGKGHVTRSIFAEFGTGVASQAIAEA